MNTMTKEWLQQTIADMEEHRELFPGDLDDNHENVLAALRIALASLEAEPSYFVNRVKHSDAYGEDVELRTYCYELDALKSKDDFGGEIVPVYTAPPAQVSVPDESAVELLATDLMKRIDKITGERHSVATLSSLRVSIVEACRAALLAEAPQQEVNNDQ